MRSFRSKCRNWVQRCSKDAVKERFYRIFPIMRWLPKYKIADLRYDLIAGVTVGLTMVPQTIAYAQMANLNAQYGLYSSFIGQIIYVFMGTSKDANIGPSAILSVLTGQISAEIMPNQLLDRGDPTCATLMAFMCGLIMMLMGVCQLGFLVNLFSIPVVAGFTSAAGFAIFASQLSNFFGLKSSVYRPPGIFVKQIKAAVDNWQSINVVDVVFGVCSLVFLLFMQYLSRIINKLCQNSCRRSARGKRSWHRCVEVLRLLIASRNVIVFFVATGVAFHLKQTIPDFKVSLVGKIAKGFPKFQIPKFYLTNGSDVLSPTPDEEDFLVSGDEPIVLRPAVDLLEVLSPGFLIISLMASMELFAITKALGRKNNYRVDASQELIVVGITNFLQSFVHGFPVTGAVARSALADQCRVKTQLAGLISATIVIVAIGALSETFQYIPKACLSAILMCASFNLIDFSILRSMWRQYRQDIFLFATTFVICLFWDIAYGILLCLLLNMITFLRPVVRMKIHFEEQAVQVPGGAADGKIVVVRLSQGMRYPSADKFTDRISTILSRDDDSKHIVIDCQFVTHVDYTGLQAFRSLLLAAVQKSKHIIFTNLNDKLQKYLARVGLEHFKYVSSVDEAVRLYNFRSRTPSLRFVSTDDDEGSPAGEMAFEADDAVENPRFLKELSVQPSFYGDIPITVGNISKVDKNGDKDKSKGKAKQSMTSHVSVNAFGSAAGTQHQTAEEFRTRTSSIQSSSRRISVPPASIAPISSTRRISAAAVAQAAHRVSSASGNMVQPASRGVADRMSYASNKLPEDSESLISTHELSPPVPAPEKQLEKPPKKPASIAIDETMIPLITISPSEPPIITISPAEMPKVTITPPEEDETMYADFANVSSTVVEAPSRPKRKRVARVAGIGEPRHQLRSRDVAINIPLLNDKSEDTTKC